MRSATVALCAALCLGPAASGASAQDAPFGLTWGMSREEARALPGLQIIREEQGKFFTAAVADRVPKELADSYFYGLLFSHRHGLVRVQWSSRPSQTDATGEGPRVRYAEVKRLLQETYGTPASRDFAWPREGWEPLRFYDCLADPQCGPYESVWAAGPVAIRLEVVGEGGGSGRVRLTYEHELLAAARRESGEDRVQRERDAL